jgi:hypothetical protein
LCDMFKDSSNTTDTEKIKSSYFWNKKNC